MNRFHSAYAVVAFVVGMSATWYGCSLETTSPVQPDGVRLVSTPERIDFGAVTVGETAERTVTLLNRDTEALQLDDLLLVDDGCFRVQFLHQGTVSAGQRLVLSVLFQPTEVREYYGNILVIYRERLETTIEVSGLGSLAPTCEDDNPCTDDHYERATGSCIHTANHRDCDDGDLCTLWDRCVGGECLGTPHDCSDGVECTLDRCVAETGECLNIPIHERCRKSDCSLPTCDPHYGCLQEWVPDGTSCGPTDGCEGAICVGGECVEGDLLDGSPCVDGQCPDQAGCQGGTCTCPEPPVPPSCDDGNECTRDYYDEVTEICRNIAVEEATCDDGNPCTRDDTCVSGVCRGRATCQDDVDCTQDYCHIDTGECLHLPDHGACASGPCLATWCDPDLGCQSDPLPDETLCGDPPGPCTRMTCEQGSCVVSAVPDGIVCGDPPGPCTRMTCEQGSCVVSTVPEGTACDEGCDMGGECIAGSCRCFVACVCGDGVVCGEEECDDGNSIVLDGCHLCSVTPLQVDDPPSRARHPVSVDINREGTVFVAFEACDQWEERWGDNLCNIYVKVYGATGDPLFDSVLVTREIGPLWPTIQGDDEGHFVVVWERLASECTFLSSQLCFFDMLAQPFDPSGQPVSDPIHVESFCRGSGLANRLSTAASDSAGNLAVVWCGGLEEEANSTQLPYRLFMQRLTADGDLIQDTIQVTSPENPYGSYPAVAINDQGTVLVTWQQIFEWPVTIWMQQFDGSGERVGEPMLLDNGENGYHAHQQPVAVNDFDRAVVAWTVFCPDCGVSGDRSFPAFYQLYDFDAAEPMSDPWPLSPDGIPPQSWLDIGIDDQGGFAVVWSEVGPLQIQRFTPSGELLGERINLIGNIEPAMAMNGDGRFAVFCSTSSLILQRYAADGRPMGRLPW